MLLLLLLKYTREEQGTVLGKGIVVTTRRHDLSPDSGDYKLCGFGLTRQSFQVPASSAGNDRPVQPVTQISCRDFRLSKLSVTGDSVLQVEKLRTQV